MPRQSWPTDQGFLLACCRVDVGSVGTHAAHPVWSVDGALGIGPSGYRSTAREHYLVERVSQGAAAGSRA
jgi:hypothetical protein